MIDVIDRVVDRLLDEEQAISARIAVIA